MIVLLLHGGARDPGCGGRPPSPEGASLLLLSLLLLVLLL